MSRETIIAGGMRSQFLYRRGIESRNIDGSSTKYFTDAVALVFARDEDKPSGISLITRLCFCNFILLEN